MIILGAGASYDSAAAYRPANPTGGGHANFGTPALPPYDGGPWRPPLAKDLFLDRHHEIGLIVSRYPKLAHILPYLREPSDGRTVEQMLESFQEESSNNTETKRELASVRFYLCELFSKITEEWSAQTNGVTNFAPLIRDALRFNTTNEEICLVTFNYDGLLERALYSFDFKGRTPQEHFDSHPTLKLFKLHGSVGWSRLVDLPGATRLSPQAIIDEVARFRISEKFVLANATNPQEAFRFEQPLFPAIAIPVQTKSDQYFECPLAHREYLAERLRYISKILIIGWQAKEAHFLDMLRFNLPQLKGVMVVGRDAHDAEATLKYFMGEIRLHVPNQYVGQGGFTTFITTHEGDNFFKG
jgi:hypothetical protein